MSKACLSKLKKLVLIFYKNSKVKIFLFGSRGRGENAITSDVDLAILPYTQEDIKKIFLLKEKIENSNIPYKVDIINLNEVSEEFKKQILKEAVIWKD